LRWAFVEAVNMIASPQKQKAWAELHVMRQHLKLRASKGHPKAAVAVARHLAESAWWVLAKHNRIVSRSRLWLRGLRPGTGKREAGVAPQRAVVMNAKPGAKMLMPEVRADR
jgi:hypothetical protein